MMFIYRLMLLVGLTAATVSCSVMRSVPNNDGLKPTNAGSVSNNSGSSSKDATSVLHKAVMPKPTANHSGGAYTLPMTMMTLTLKINDKGLTVEEPKLTKVPDARMLFSLDYLADITSDDTFKVELDQSGFLKQVTVAADDKKGPIIEAIASTVLTLMTGIPVPVKEELRSLVDRGGVLLQETFNPNDETEVRDLNSRLGKYSLKVVVKDFGTGYPYPELLPQANDSSNRSGIFYRPLRSYKVLIQTYDNLKKDWETFNAYVIQTENNSPLVSVDISRSYFVKRETTLMFNMGTLTSTEVKKPSEVLGLVKIPLNIAMAIVEIPMKLVQFRIDYSNKQTALLENQKKLIEAQQNLLDAIEKEKEKEKEKAKSTSASTEGSSNRNHRSPPAEGTDNQRDGD